jgi:hypothetical protein
MPTFRKPALLQPGMYDTKIVTVKPGTSKTGNEMFVVTAEIYFDGKTHSLNDYLMLSGPAQWKFESFASATGNKVADGDQVDPEVYVGRSARVVVGIDYYEGRQQNKIKKWITSTEASTSTTPSQGSN